ncbi:MAG: galactokinase [Treponema sp.]
MHNIVGFHVNEYGDEPFSCVAVPGRFHLLGEQTWFAKGNTLSVTIDSNLYLCISKRQDSNFRFYSLSLNERRRVSLANLKYRKEDRWANSLKAIIASFNEAGYEIPGLNFTILSEIPPNAGLGTPNALKVATAMALSKLFPNKLSDNDLVKIIEHANVEYLNTYPHTSDILCVLNTEKDHCVKIDSKKRLVSSYPLELDGYSVILTDSCVPRSVVREELGSRIAECTNAYETVVNNADTPKNTSRISEALLKELDISEIVRRRVSHIIREASSIEDAIDAIKKNDKVALSRIFIRSHESLRDRFEISCPELDWLVKRTLEFIEPVPSSLICARMTGKGFGGCVYSILKTKDVPLYKEKLEDYERIFGFRPVSYEVKIAGKATYLI